MARKKRKKKLKLKKSIKFMLFLLVLFLFVYSQNFFNIFEYKRKNISAETSEEHKGIIKKLRYDNCIKDGITEENFNENTINAKKELTQYLNNNNIYYYYQDKDYGYEIKRKETEAIYGASLVKLSTALYLIDNDVDLSTEVTYFAKFKTAYSKGMQNHKIGDKVSLGELMKYSITYSDNTAHHMILNYIGKTKLQEYSKSLGAKVLLTGWDDFGNQTAEDMNIYLNRAYELFTEKENGKLLKEYMNNTDTNALNFDDVTFMHKYGSYSLYFHDVGIYNGEHPYNVSVLTTKTEAKGPTYVKKVSQLTYNFHKAYYENIDSYCKKLIYGED